MLYDKEHIIGFAKINLIKEGAYAAIAFVLWICSILLRSIAISGLFMLMMTETERSAISSLSFIIKSVTSISNLARPMPNVKNLDTGQLTTGFGR